MIEMKDEAKRIGTVLDFHLAEARRLIERMESLEEIAVEQRIAERVGHGRWRRTEFQDQELGDVITMIGRREGFKKILSATLRRLRLPARDSGASGFRGSRTSGSSARSR
jgi:hypothetical protein